MEQTERIPCLHTMNLELRENLCEVYAIINAYEVEHISVAGVMFNLMNGAKHARFIPPTPAPPPKNTFEIGGITVQMSDP